jgi:SAM-dependent methyltransferase
MDPKKYTEANRDAWNEATHVHQKHRGGSLKEKFREKGFSTLDETITAMLKDIGLKDKHVAQVFCNNGRELLSIINLGAASGVGFDISDEAIKEADELKNISGLKAEFVRTDIFDIDKIYFNKFELVYISIGGLTWVQDLDAAFGKIIGLLKPGGHLVIYDQHPFYFMLALDDEDGYDPAHPDKPVYSYFKTEPWSSTSGIDYVGKTKYKAKVNYSFTHKFADIITTVAQKGIVIKELYEYPHDLTEALDDLAEKKIIPLSYLLIGKKS